MWFEIIFVIVSLYKFSNHKFKDFLALFFSLIIGFLLARFAGLFYSHLQPFAIDGFEPIIYHAPDNSFPSDHLVIGGALASFLFTVNKKSGLVAFILALGVALGRVMGGIHYPIDVIAGLAIGVLAAIILKKIFDLIRGYSGMGEN